ncbi:MAG: Gldg family protein [Kiritimatiellae bacterium]|nr:Gldg family protein [Kiritimatiellia bacterium]
MSASAVTFKRTIGRMRNSFQTALAIASFLAASGALFSYKLVSAEGTASTFVELWASSVSVFLPLLAAFLGMDIWSEERRTGMADVLLSSPVREREFVFGKALGVFGSLAFSAVLSCVITAECLSWYAPVALSEVRILSFALSFAALLVQGGLWCAATTALSAAFTSAASSFCASAILLAALPRAIWLSLMAFAPSGRMAFGRFPLDAHVEDCAAGVFPIGLFVVLISLTILSLFLASKKISSLKYCGRVSRKHLREVALEMVLSCVFAVGISILALRFDFIVELPISSHDRFSPRMRQVLSESSGKVIVTSFLSRRDPRFRPLARNLRSLKRLADHLGGIAIELQYVDPKWDIGPAGRLASKGARDGSIMLEMGRRSVMIDLADSPGERDLVSALRRLIVPLQRKDIRWVAGHGELRPDSYGSWGMSDIARELAREGYRNLVLDLAAGDVPQECALMVIAGAKDDFSRVELGRVNEYLKKGGRLLVLMGRTGQGGVSSLLPSWGMRPAARPITGAKTLSGTDVVVPILADHPISSALTGSRIVLESPLVFDTAAVVESGTGADRIEFTPLAGVGEDVVAAVVERGSGAGSDLAIRPTRIVAVGDGAFVSNGALAVRSCANRDFLLNIVAYLSGTDAMGASGVEPHVLVTGLDRNSRFAFTMVLALALPLSVLVVLSSIVYFRRRIR